MFTNNRDANSNNIFKTNPPGQIGAPPINTRRTVDISNASFPITRRKKTKIKRIDFSSLVRRNTNDDNNEPQTIESFCQALDQDNASPLLSSDVEVVSTKQRISSWALSIIAHAAIIAILAFLFFPIANNTDELEAVFSTEIGEQLDFLTEDEGNLNPNDAKAYALTVPQELKIEDANVFEKEELPFLKDVAAPIFEQARIEMNDILEGRTDPGLKNDLLSKYGGNKLTEESIALGLEWLRKQQQKDGSWSLTGPYTGGIRSVDNKPAATALALLAFQGAGNSRYSGEHSAIVRRAWTWLLKQQNQDGSFAPKERSQEALFYTQALCVIALCEEIAMEKRANAYIRKQAESAIQFLVENQHKTHGGWKYVPQEQSDLSVTGWCVMALKTAEIAGFNIPNSVYERISFFLDSVAYNDGSEYVYQLVRGKITDQEKRASMTAAGLLCREYLGWEPNNQTLLKGAATLVEEENLIHFPTQEELKRDSNLHFSHNVYGWYSTSMALKGLGPYNKYWRRWNATLSRELPKNQEPRGTAEAGSWDPKFDEYSFGGGRLYVTCMSILCLEVYYRHLSIYR